LDPGTIDRTRLTALEREVARLQARLGDDRLANDLRARLAAVGALGTLAAPTEQAALLEQIVQTAMHVLHAQAGSLYLLDEDTDELIFEVALGERAAPLRGLRIPLGQGIAGWVAATGQAIAVADVQQDERWAREIARTTGYEPHTMLALPLLLGDETIGVLQLLDKEGGATFSANDMTTLGLFAQQAAVAIAQSSTVGHLTTLVHQTLRGLVADDQLAAELADFAQRTEQSAAYRDLQRLAELLRRLAWQGDAGRRFCLEMTEAVVRYLEASGQIEA
jgi:GAF domain-containing protein